MLHPSDLDDPWKGRWVAGQVRVSDEPPGPAIGMSPPTPISPVFRQEDLSKKSIGNWAA